MTSLAHLDVPDLLTRLGLTYQRKGRELWCSCPFHADGQERTPSFCVRDQPGDEERHAHYRCYGSCEVRGGSVVGLVMRLHGVDRQDAWRWIGGAGAPPPALRVDLVEVRGSRAPFRLPQGVVVAPLGAWVSPARRYAEQRGLTPAQVERWGLGYAVEGRLRGRLVLPVRDACGRVTSYTARTFVGSPKKWLEPAGEEHGDKGSVFGEQHWPPAGDRQRVVVAEAALDALAVERVLPGPVAAVYGSELMPGHVARLSTFPEVVVASDPDAAGDKLVDQVAVALGRWSVVRRAILPAGHDACSLEREDPTLLYRALTG